MPSTDHLVKPDNIETRIHFIRGRKVMLDSDLAELYGVETKYLLRQVNRNADRFPSDFMFSLDKKEVARLRCQIGTSKGRGGRRYTPYAFTEQGVAMLSGVLRSKRAIQVNILIMRAFVQLRFMISTNNELSERLDSLEKKYDARFRVVFDAIELGKISKEQRAGNWDVWQTSLHNPDFARYAELCGALGIKVSSAGELDEALGTALAHDGPALVEIRADVELI